MKRDRAEGGTVMRNDRQPGESLVDMALRRHREAVAAGAVDMADMSAVERHAHWIDEAERLRKQRDALQVEVDVLTAMNDMLNHPVKSPCGHSSRYAISTDGGKTIYCLTCQRDALLDAAKEAERGCVTALDRLADWEDADNVLPESIMLAVIIGKLRAAIEACGKGGL